MCHVRTTLLLSLCACLLHSALSRSWDYPENGFADKVSALSRASYSDVIEMLFHRSIDHAPYATALITGWPILPQAAVVARAKGDSVFAAFNPAKASSTNVMANLVSEKWAIRS